MAQHTLKKLKWNNVDTQVESAVRDGAGNVISSTYQTALGVNTGTATAQLTKLTINGVVYELAGSGGSSTSIEILDLRD